MFRLRAMVSLRHRASASARATATALAAMLALGATSAGCSPILYLVLQARHDDVHAELPLDRAMAGSTRNAGDSYSPSCIHDDGPDEAWSFTPSVDGTYWFQVLGDYDTALAVYASDGHELACNDDFGSTRESRLSIPLHRGERYLVVIDGYNHASGSYTVKASDHDPTPAARPPTAPPAPPPVPVDAPGMAARCESAESLTPGALTGTIDPGVHTAAVTCGDHGPGGDRVYRFVANTPGTLSVTESSFFDAILELRAGCDGGHTVLACVDDAPDTRHSAVSAHVTAGMYSLVVDAYSPTAAGPFALLVDWRPDALMSPSPSAVPAPAGPSEPTGAQVHTASRR